MLEVSVTVPAIDDTETVLTGIVLDTDGNPLSGVPVELGGFADTTNADGSFSIILPTLHVPTDDFSIAVPAGDPMLDPFGTGRQSIPLRRARHDPASGTGLEDPRQHPNLVTSFLDASAVYGSTLRRSNALRTFEGGTLKIDAGNLPPAKSLENFPKGTLENDNEGRSPPESLFSTGDTRANENGALASRAGTVTDRFFGNADPLLLNYANTADSRQLYLMPVGKLLPNPYGIFECYGNAMDMCLHIRHGSVDRQIPERYGQVFNQIPATGGSFLTHGMYASAGAKLSVEEKASNEQHVGCRLTELNRKAVALDSANARP